MYLKGICITSKFFIIILIRYICIRIKEKLLWFCIIFPQNTTINKLNIFDLMVNNPSWLTLIQGLSSIRQIWVNMK